MAEQTAEKPEIAVDQDKKAERLRIKQIHHQPREKSADDAPLRPVDESVGKGDDQDQVGRGSQKGKERKHAGLQDEGQHDQEKVDQYSLEQDPEPHALTLRPA